MRSAAQSDTGQVRTRNEDAYSCDPVRGIFIVADGAGTLPGGELTAGQVVDIISTELTLAIDRGLNEFQLADAMYDAFREASADIYTRAKQSKEPQDTACSAVAAILLKEECLIAHAGDVRA